MKYLLTLCLASVGWLCVAQNADTANVSPQIKQDFLVKRLTEELNLSKEQQNAIRSVLETRSEAITTAKSFEGIQRKNAIQEANGEARSSLKTVLTKEQFDLFIELRQQLKKQRDQFYADREETYKSEDDELDF